MTTARLPVLLAAAIRDMGAASPAASAEGTRLSPLAHNPAGLP